MSSRLITLRVDDGLLERLEAETLRERARESEPLRRSTMVRRLLREALEARGRKEQP